MLSFNFLFSPASHRHLTRRFVGFSPLDEVKLCSFRASLHCIEFHQLNSFECAMIILHFSTLSIWFSVFTHDQLHFTAHYTLQTGLRFPLPLHFFQCFIPSTIYIFYFKFGSCFMIRVSTFLSCEERKIYSIL